MTVKLGKQAILIMIISVIIATLLFVVLPSSQSKTAYASNDEIPYIGFADGYSDIEYNQLDGLQLAITCSTEIYKMTYVFQYTNENDDLEGELELSINPDDPDEYIATYHAYDNGYFQVTSYVLEADKETITEYTSDLYLIDNIDSQAPKVDESLTSSIVNGNTVEYAYTLTDRISVTSDNSYSAYSGISYVGVFFFNYDFDYDNVDLDSLDYDSLKEANDMVTFLVDLNVVGTHTTVPIEFTASEDGLYCMYVLDNVGNSSFIWLFPLELEPVYSIEINGVTINCGDLLTTAENQYEAGEDTYAASILSNLKTAIDNLTIAFINDYSDEEKYAMWSALNEAQSAYNAAARKEIYADVILINGEYISGDLYFKNLNTTTVPALYGELVQPTVTVAKFTDTSDVNSDIISASGIDNANLVIRLSYSLTKDGTLILPTEDITLFMTLPESYKSLSIVCDTQSGYTVVSDLTFGTQWLQFDIPFSNMDYYLVVYDSANSSFLGSMTTIQLVAFFGGIVAVVVIITATTIVVIKKKKLKAAAEGNTADSNVEADTNTEVDNTDKDKIEEKEVVKYNPKNKKKK